VYIKRKKAGIDMIIITGMGPINVLNIFGAK
jgi:tRNA A22 N-methylase